MCRKQHITYNSHLLLDLNELTNSKLSEKHMYLYICIYTYMYLYAFFSVSIVIQNFSSGYT